MNERDASFITFLRIMVSKLDIRKFKNYVTEYKNDNPLGFYLVMSLVEFLFWTILGVSLFMVCFIIGLCFVLFAFVRFRYWLWRMEI